MCEISEQTNELAEKVYELGEIEKAIILLYEHKYLTINNFAFLIATFLMNQVDSVVVMTIVNVIDEKFPEVMDELCVKMRTIAMKKAMEVLEIISSIEEVDHINNLFTVMVARQ